MPDIAKVSAAGDGKKQKIEEKGVVNMKGGASKKGDDEFTDFHFKEGHTACVKMADIFVHEKGQAAFKKMNEPDRSGAAKVKGGVKGKKKAASKGKAKSASAGKKSAEKEVKQNVAKIMKFTPSKGKRAGTPGAGKVSAARKSASHGKKQTPAMPSPGGKKSTQTTDKMTMNQFKKYLEWHEKKKGGKTLGKRSAGKSSARSGGKRSAKQ